MTKEKYIHKLIDLSQKKHLALIKILKLTEEQSLAISEDNIEGLQKLLDLKQLEMDIIDQLDDEFEVYYFRLKSDLGVESLEELRLSEINGSAELKQIITSISDILRQIQVIENQNNNKVKELMDDLSTQIKQVKQGQIANNGYNIASKLPQQSYYFDTKK